MTMNRLLVANRGDRPVQVGSHFHFFEVNRALEFDRAAAFGLHLNIPSSTAMRFEPGDEREVALVPFGGKRTVFGFNNLVDGPTAGKDAAAGKPTYPALFGLAESRRLAAECADRARAALAGAELGGQLPAIIDWVTGRSN